MKEAEFRAVKKYCQPLVRKWVRLMGAGWDTVDAVWVDSEFSKERDGHGPRTVAFCDASWEYLQATITFSVSRIAVDYFEKGVIRDKEAAYRLEAMIAHEIGHIVVNQMREYDGSCHAKTVKHEERVVESLARAFLYTYRQGIVEGKRLRVKTEKSPPPKGKR